MAKMFTFLGKNGSHFSRLCQQSEALTVQLTNVQDYLWIFEYFGAEVTF